MKKQKKYLTIYYQGNDGIMNIDTSILEFIKKTRISLQYSILSDSEQERLKLLFDECLSFVVKEYYPEHIPSLIICNTYNKYSMVLPVRINKSEYKYYLLYDCYLNQINRLFDSIYLDNNDSTHDIWKLSYELFAEDALLDNNEILVSYYGLNKVGLGAFEVKCDVQVNLDFILHIQERYIIGHEIGHWIYMINESNMEHKELLLNISLDDDWSGFMNNIKNLLIDLYKEYELKYKSMEYIQLIEEQSDIVNSNREILEECFADAVAYAMIFAYIDSDYSNNISLKILAGQALFLQMMNLQMLGMQHMYVTEKSFEKATSIRLGFFRNYVGLYFDKDESLFNNMLEETVIRYETRITNLMIESFSELEYRADNIYDALIDSNDIIDLSLVVGLYDI